MTITNDRVEAGQAVYTKQTLAIYDFIVLGISNRFIWKCPTQELLKQYNQTVTANHLDVGVGTGYFLDQCQFPSLTPHLTLMDLNPNTLDFASKRIARYEPTIHLQNILEPITVGTKKFDSIGLNYLLHCLPGNLDAKSVVFDHLKVLMNPGAVLFGATILQGDISRNWFAKRLMATYNKKGIFSNEDDSIEGLEKALNQRFKDVSVNVIGCVALFSGRV